MKLVKPLWKTVWRVLRKLKIELPYNPAIPLLGTYPNKTIIQKDTCTLMFTVALFTIAKTWKQPLYMYIYKLNIQCCPAVKKYEIMPFAATWMSLEIIILSEVRKTNTILYHVHVESKIRHK